MTGNIVMFSNLDESVKSQVTLGTDSKVSVMGKGRVDVMIKKGEKNFMLDFYYVPRLKFNLLSIGQLMQKGYNVFFKDYVCKIMDTPPSTQLIAKVHMKRNRMFPLNMRSDLKEGGVVATVTQEFFQEEVKYKNCLWHLRFGHLNFGGLN